MILKIKVTKDCIKNGVSESGDSCAIALAVKDVFPKVFVDIDGVYPNGLYSKFYGYIIRRHKPIPIPEDVKQFIEWFDEKTSYRGLMEPFEFEIDVPDDVINKINIDELRPLLTNHKNLELVEETEVFHEDYDGPGDSYYEREMESGGSRPTAEDFHNWQKLK